MKNLICIIVIIVLSQLLISCGEKSDPSNIDGFAGIIIVNSDGTDPIRVENTDFVLYPQLIPNSDKILFIKDDNLYSINEDGSEKKQLTYGLEVHNGEPASFSNDGQQVYFSARSTERQNYAIYKFSFIDNNVELVRSHPGFNCYNLDLSTDSNRLLVTEYGDPNSIVVEIDLLTGDADTLLYNQFDYAGYDNAIYGLDGKIYYLGYSNFIYSLNSFSKESNINTVLLTNVSSPLAISPNREVLAFEFYSVLHYFIDETDLVKVSQVFDFVVSNDAIVYEDYSDLYKIDFSNGEIVELARNASYPSFSQDGQKIAYIRILHSTKDDRNYITK